MGELPLALACQLDALEGKVSGLDEAEEEEVCQNAGFYVEEVVEAGAPYEVEEVEAEAPYGVEEVVAAGLGGEGEEGGAVGAEEVVALPPRYLAVFPNIVAGEGKVTNECHVHSFYNCVTVAAL